MEYKEEEGVWSNFVLEKFFFSEWRNNFLSEKKSSGKSLELDIRGFCNLKCKYCYMQNYKKDLYPDEIDKFEVSLSNIKKIAIWLLKEKLLPSSFDIFGGEAISVEQFKELFSILEQFVDNLEIYQRKKFGIFLPVNVIFLKNKEYYELFKSFQMKLWRKNVRVGYSISLDGKYCDPHSRPALDKNFKYDDEFYEIVSRFSFETESCFHPMIAKENISFWKKNFLWYIDFLKKTKKVKTITEAMEYLYLLEVRNFDWGDKEIKDLNSFFRFLVRYLIKHLSKDDVINNVAFGKKLNNFSFFGLSAKGISCSLQNMLVIRTGDMTIAPCHRLFYKNFHAFQIVEEKGSLVFSSLNPHGWLSGLCVNTRNISPCSECEINNLCSGPCLGSNYEANKDMFIVDENVCKMEKNRIFTIIKEFDRAGVLEEIIRKHESNIFGKKDSYSVYIRSKLRQIKFLRSL